MNVEAMDGDGDAVCMVEWLSRCRLRVSVPFPCLCLRVCAPGELCVGVSPRWCAAQVGGGSSSGGGGGGGSSGSGGSGDQLNRVTLVEEEVDDFGNFRPGLACRRRVVTQVQVQVWQVACLPATRSAAELAW